MSSGRCVRRNPIDLRSHSCLRRRKGVLLKTPPPYHFCSVYSSSVSAGFLREKRRICILSCRKNTLSLRPGAPTITCLGHAMSHTVNVSDLSRRFNHEALQYYPRLAQVLNYVQGRLSKPISLEDAATAAGLEKKYFSAFFHSKVGTTFTEWVRVLRVERAAMLMGGGEEMITRVALRSGFADVRTFERAFKRYVGVTPRAYRKAVRPETRWMSQSSRKMPRNAARNGRTSLQ
jgi:AraC-like DNA-binding protein